MTLPRRSRHTRSPDAAGGSHPRATLSGLGTLPAWRLARAAVCCVTLVLISGCARELDDKYVSYGQLEKGTPAAEPESKADGEVNKTDQSPETGEPNGAANQQAAADDAQQTDPGGANENGAEQTGTKADGQVANGDPESAAGSPIQTVANRVVSGDAVNVAATGENAAGGAPAEPREIKLLIPQKDFAVEGPDGALRVSYDDFDLLKVLNMEPVPADAADYMPDWLKELDGKRVVVRGFMYPTFRESGIERFILARDNQICCFGRDPKIYDLVRVKLRTGQTTDYILNRPFDVAGVFHILPEAFDGQLERLYVIDDAVVID